MGKRAEEILGTYGDDLAIDILLDFTITPAERDRRLAEAARKYAAHVKRHVKR